MTSTLRVRWIGDHTRQWFMQTLNYRLPAPPYGMPEYWDHSYKDFSELEPKLEFGLLEYTHLKEYQYRVLIDNYIAITQQNKQRHNATKFPSTFDKNPNPVIHTTLQETLLGPNHAPGRSTIPRNDKLYNEKDDDPILELGCGNSSLGFDMWNSQLYRGPIIQIDVSTRIVDLMTRICCEQIKTGDMIIHQDDATQLSSISESNSISACLDKGLMDALFCSGFAKARNVTLPVSADQEQCMDILKAVHRVLKPNGYYCFWSYSQPHFWIPFLQPPHISPVIWQRMWQRVEVRHDVKNGVLLYRFQKAAGDSPKINKMSSRNTNRARPTGKKRRN